MKYFNLRFTLSFVKLFFIGLIAISALSNGYVQAQDKGKEKEKKKKKTDIFDVGFGVGVMYDDNILKYSEKYLERFLSGQDFGRFHIETYDDVILKPSLQVGATLNIFKKQKSKLSLSYNYNSYIVNDIKNWQFISIGFQQNFLKKASFRIAYSYVPDFYVRHFRDEDMVEYFKEIYGFGYIPESFVPFSFSKDNYSIWVQNTFFKRTRVRLSLDYAQYFHNEHYTEYDCDNLYYGVHVFQGIGKKVDLELGFEFMTSDAKGYDEPFETKETSDDADADNEGDSFFLGASWELPKLLKMNHSVGAGIEYLIRYYTTENYVELDPEHAGRVDYVVNLDINYRLKLSKSAEIGAFYKWFGRDSKTTSELNSNYVSDEKDYKQSQVGLEFTYNFKF
jgi:hypothetical protein